MIQGSGQILSTASMGKVSVCRMSSKELFLLSQRIFHRITGIDILLAPVDDADETQLQRVGAASQNVQGIGPGIHQIQLGEHADGPKSSRIDGTRQLQRIRVRNVDVCGRNRQDDAVG